MAEIEDAQATYTKDGHKKKQRRWFDGTIQINRGTRHAVLKSEQGDTIATGTIPTDVDIVDDSEEFVLVAPSILVVITSLNAPATALPLLQLKTTTRVNENAVPSNGRLHKPFAPPTGGGGTPQQPRPLKPTSAAPPTAPPSAVPIHAFHPAEQQRQQRSALDILKLVSSPPLAASVIAVAPPPPSSSLDAALSRRRTAEMPPPLTKRQKLPNTIHPNPAAPPPPPSSSSPGHQQYHQQYHQHSAATGKWDPRPPRGSASAPLPSPMPPPSSVSSSSSFSLHQRPLQQQNTTAAAAAAAPPPFSQITSHAPGSIYFPTSTESSHPTRRVPVPDRFPTAAAYQSSWEKSLTEEMVLRLTEMAKDFHAAASKVAPGASYAGANIESAMRKGKVPYHDSCELFIWKNLPNRKDRGSFVGGGRGRGKRRKGGGDGGNSTDSEDAEDAPSKPENVYLILKSGRTKNADYSKNDVWVISSHPLMKSGFVPGSVGDRSKAPWTAVVRSVWHGPNQDGKFEVEFLSSRPPTIGRSTQVYALKGPNASTELSLLDLLRSNDALHRLPLLPALLGNTSLQQPPQLLLPPSSLDNTAPSKVTKTAVGVGSVGDDDDDDEEETNGNEKAEEEIKTKTPPAEHAEAIITQFKLNPEQAQVLRHVATWATTPSPAANKNNSPVCLVFGPFGCGKSTLLVAVLHLLLILRKEENNNPLSGVRVLVSAHTNVAVDRVLLGLLESGCTDFLRVGGLRRIDRGLLRHSLHASESKSHANASAELKEMLREGAGTMSVAEEATLRAELAAAESGAERQRKRLLKTVPVVGVTCCSSLLPVLDNLAFDVVILDECSQIIEPLAMAPILRAQAKFLVAAGDPKQLPPVIAHPSLITPPTLHGLHRPLFVRLSALGAAPHLLRRQYRCHPLISAVPNAHFYDGALLDGCSAEARPSLLPGLPPVVFVDVRGQEERSSMRSTSNPQEAQAVARVLEKALHGGVAPGNCGVICFYRAQVAAVKAALLQHGPQLQAAINSSGDGATSSNDDSEKEESPPENYNYTAIQVATVDAFQGAEKDLIILTTATTKPGAFAADAARLNVALTRARHNLVVVGCAPALDRTAPAFAAVLKTARSTPGGYSNVGGMLPIGGGGG